jgi:hypothetical protein
VKNIAFRILAAVALLALDVSAQSPTPSPTAAPIVLPSPTVIPVTQPISIILTAAQVQAIVTALTGAGINLPSGIRGVNFRLITTGTNSGGAWVQLRFQ